jgi:outer membrane lipoprotein-sorting protein
MKLFLSLLAVALVVLSVQAFSEPKIVTELKNGTKTLECEFTDGWRVVPSEKIVGLDDVSGRFIFTNGSAKTCEIY